MSHEVYKIGSDDSMAFVGETPWHGLGQRLPEDAPIETWAKTAHLDWSLIEKDISYDNGNGPVKFEGKKALVRSDTGEGLSVVSTRYRVVQPGQVLEFFRDLVDNFGMKLHTAGTLDDGRKVWALAKIGKSTRIMGQDKLDGYVLLATSCDGTLSTTAMWTAIRVVCANTLSFAYDSKDTGLAVKVPHTAIFNPDYVKIDLGLMDKQWTDFEAKVNKLAEIRMSDLQAKMFVEGLFTRDTIKRNKETGQREVETTLDDRKVSEVLDLWRYGRGASMKSAKDTLWGLVNGVTEYYDHHVRARSTNNRFRSSQIGPAANSKKAAFDLAVQIAKAA
jgi:phage/plasmid-like protein (TIGR03299 family)